MTNVGERAIHPTLPAAEALCRSELGPSVSIYMPVEGDWGELAQNAIRFKNLLRVVERRLDAMGVSAATRRAMLASAQGALPAPRQDRPAPGGLAVFAQPDEVVWFRLREPIPEMLHVGERYHVRPLLEAVSQDRACYALSLGLGGVSLCHADVQDLRMIELPGVPASLKESLRFDVVEPHQHVHSGTGPAGAGQMHGQGGAGDRAVVKKQMLEYFRQVASGVSDALAGSTLPLVLLGLPHLVGLYREANHYPHLHEHAILTDPAVHDQGAIRDRAIAVLDPDIEADRHRRLDKFMQMHAGTPERAPIQLEEVIEAAAAGRVETLFVARGRFAWGRWTGSGETVVHTGRRAGDEDLVDRAAWLTIRHGGRFEPVDADAVPGGGVVRPALLRF